MVDVFSCEAVRITATRDIPFHGASSCAMRGNTTLHCEFAREEPFMRTAWRLLTIVIIANVSVTPVSAQFATGDCAYFSSVATGRIPLRGFLTNSVDAMGPVHHLALIVSTEHQVGAFIHMANRNERISKATITETTSRYYYVIDNLSVAGYEKYNATLSIVSFTVGRWTPLPAKFNPSLKSC